jgi:hypothetical protein
VSHLLTPGVVSTVSFVSLHTPGNLLTLDGAVALGDEVARRAPAWRAAAEEAVTQLGADTRSVVDATADDGSPAARALQLIFVEAANDFWDTLHDAATGRGRPALRATRTLFELRLDALDVASNSTLAERWQDHLPVADVAEGNLTRVERHLAGDARRTVRRRMSHIRKRGERELAKARARWGKNFGTRWHPQSSQARSLGSPSVTARAAARRRIVRASHSKWSSLNRSNNSGRRGRSRSSRDATSATTIPTSTSTSVGSATDRLATSRRSVRPSRSTQPCTVPAPWTSYVDNVR